MMLEVKVGDRVRITNEHNYWYPPFFEYAQNVLGTITKVDELRGCNIKFDKKIRVYEMVDNQKSFYTLQELTGISASLGCVLIPREQKTTYED